MASKEETKEEVKKVTAIATSFISVDVCYNNVWQQVSINQFGSFRASLKTIRRAFKHTAGLRKRDTFKLELVGGGFIERNMVLQENDKLMLKLINPSMKVKRTDADENQR